MSSQACATMHLLVQAELDGELDAAGAAALAAHSAECPGCTALQAELAALSTRLRAGLTRHVAPASLRRLAAPAPAPAPLPRARRRLWDIGASFGAGLALAAGLAAIMVLPERGTGVPEVVSAHIRALQPGHLVDIGSSDQHTVKPWFDGRIDFAPPVRDFSAEGYPLVGARLDSLAGRPVAVLVYGRRKHLIDVFVWPSGTGSTDHTANGYNVEAWSQSGMNFRAVSDLNPAELAALAALLRSPGA